MKTLYLRMTLWLGMLCVGYGFFCPWGVRPHFYPFMNTYYDLQTEAVLDRRLDLNIPVDRDFFETSDPISFAAYHAYIDDAQGVHDLSYYKGKLFSYFGMAPVFTLYLPYRLLSGGGIASRSCGSIVFLLRDAGLGRYAHDLSQGPVFSEGSRVDAFIRRGRDGIRQYKPLSHMVFASL